MTLEGKMIYINGQKSAFEINQFANLEELLLATNESCNNAHQIITAVHLNDELFDELYPHQAEDIEPDEIKKVEITAISFTEMASQIVEELFKVTASVKLASVQASESLRRGDDMDALTTISNMTDVIRNFMTMISCFQQDFNAPKTPEYTELSEKYKQLLLEITEAMENEDWILVADLLEFEISPLCAEWDNYLTSLRFYFQTEVNGISQ